MGTTLESFFEAEYILKELLKPLSTEESESSSSNEFISDAEPPDKKACVRIRDYTNIVSQYSEYEFKAHYRLARTTVDRITDLFRNSNYFPRNTNGRENISAECTVYLVIWYLVNQETFREVSDRFDVTISSAHRCLRRVVKFLLSIKNAIIKWPSEEELDRISEGFYRRQGINNIIGSIDGSHVEISRPKNQQAAYVNRKGYHSLLLQGICDHQKKFIDVFCGEPGSIHDARMLRKSGIYAKINESPQVLGERFLIGDSAYPNLHWLVTPFKDAGHLTREQNIFNHRLSASRVIIEHCFGLLKGRFRRLKKFENLNILLCSEIIMSACVLHNICIDANDLIDVERVDFNQPEHMPLNRNVGTAFNNIDVNRRQQVFNEMFNCDYG